MPHGQHPCLETGWVGRQPVQLNTVYMSSEGVAQHSIYLSKTIMSQNAAELCTLPSTSAISVGTLADSYHALESHSDGDNHGDVVHSSMLMELLLHVPQDSNVAGTTYGKDVSLHILTPCRQPTQHYNLKMLVYSMKKLHILETLLCL
jgi:hypothetical protein